MARDGLTWLQRPGVRAVRLLLPFEGSDGCWLCLKRGERAVVGGAGVSTEAQDATEQARHRFFSSALHPCRGVEAESVEGRGK